MLKNNYHTHTSRCHHAVDEDEAYVLEAIRAGIETLGFSDHIPFLNGPESRIRMDISEMNGYLENIRYLRDKYADQIRILVGFEAEYIDDEIPFYQSLLNENKVDYLIFGNHLYEGYETSSQRIENAAQLQQYVDRAIAGMKSGLFQYLAHPDLFMVNIKDFDENCVKASEQLCQAALDLDMPIEFNCEGLRDHLNGHIFKNGTTLAYPHPQFWKIAAKMKNKVILGADAHASTAVNDKAIKEAIRQTKEFNLNMIDHLEI